MMNDTFALHRTIGGLALSLIACSGPSKGISTTTAAPPSTTAAPASSSASAEASTARAPAPPTPTPVPAKVGNELTFISRALPKGHVFGAGLDAFRAQGELPSTKTVIISLGADELVLTGSLTLDDKPFTVAVASPIPHIPFIGWIERADGMLPLDDERCIYKQEPAPEASHVNGEKNPPEVLKACRAILARHEKFQSDFNERFIRRYVLTRDGVATMARDGSKSVVADVKLHAGERYFEAHIPRAAFPHFAQAPVSALVAGAVDAAAPDELVPPLMLRPAYSEAMGTPASWPGWTKLTIASPVSFDRRGILTALFNVFDGSRHQSFGLTVLSYAPTDPSVIRILEAPYVRGGAQLMDRPAVVEATKKLYAPVESLGDATVGLVRGHLPFLVSHKGDELVSIMEARQVRATRRRGDALHIFSFWPQHMPIGSGLFHLEHWTVHALTPSGELTLISEPGEVHSYATFTKTPKAFHNADYTEVGVRGTFRKKPKRVAWKWNPDTKMYERVITPKSAAVF